MAKLLFWL